MVRLFLAVVLVLAAAAAAGAGRGAVRRKALANGNSWDEARARTGAVDRVDGGATGLLLVRRSQAREKESLAFRVGGGRAVSMGGRQVKCK